MYMDDCFRDSESFPLRKFLIVVEINETIHPADRIRYSGSVGENFRITKTYRTIDILRKSTRKLVKFSTINRLASHKIIKTTTKKLYTYPGNVKSTDR